MTGGSVANCSSLAKLRIVGSSPSEEVAAATPCRLPSRSTVSPAPVVISARPRRWAFGSTRPLAGSPGETSCQGEQGDDRKQAKPADSASVTPRYGFGHEQRGNPREVVP